MQRSWPRRVHFLPPIIWIQAGLLCLLLKDGDLVNDSNLFFYFKITHDWLKRVRSFSCCVSLNNNIKRTLTQIRPTAIMWYLLKAIQEQVRRGWFISKSSERTKGWQESTRFYTTYPKNVIPWNWLHCLIIKKRTFYKRLWSYSKEGTTHSSGQMYLTCFLKNC